MEGNKKMNHGSLFSGIGGFDLAAEWMGWDNKFHCERNEFGQKILKHYWPNAKSYGDINTTNFTVWRGEIDILTGGFPCQPYSIAGKRKGKEDERHLWPEMLRAIREIKPKYVVGENVYGLVNWNGGLVFNEVQSDLEAEEYKVLPVILPACGINAPHKRERIWFVAYTTSYRRKWKWKKVEIKKGLHSGSEPTRIMEGRFEGLCGNGVAANTSIGGLEGAWDKGVYKEEKFPKSSRPSTSRIITYSTSNGGGQNNRERKSRFFNEESKENDWQNFPTQPPICSGNDGISSRLDGITFSKWRNESIKGYGNAIVPRVAYEIFKVINQIQHNEEE